MDYYLNEYSLRGQFKDIDEFFASLRNCTLPVLKRIEQNNENIIWKKDTFWQCEICNGISLLNVKQKKNERSGEYTAFKVWLRKLVSESPFWGSFDVTNFNILEYKFDEEYSVNFEHTNCFTKAIESEGRILSFEHEQYKNVQLNVVICCEENNQKCSIDNIFAESWWEKEPKITTWRIGQKYLIEIRANEYDFHPPHFHVSCNESSAVYNLNDGEIYVNKKKMSPQMLADIDEWYKVHRDELVQAWENLHGHI